MNAKYDTKKNKRKEDIKIEVYKEEKREEGVPQVSEIGSFNLQSNEVEA